MSTPNAAIAAPAPTSAAPTADSTAPKAELTAEDIAAEAELDGSEEQTPEEAAKSAKSADSKDKTKKKDEKAVEKRLKKLKLKVDGKEIEEELDLDDDERLIRELQMAKMGQKRAQEKSDLEKQVQAFMQAIGKDPMAALKELGLNPDKIVESYIDQQLENSKKTPEQIEAERAREELKALKAEREREREELKNKELTRLQEQAFQQYDMQMEQVLNKSGLPKTPLVVKKMAEYMSVALEAGKDVSPEDVVDLVREEMQSDTQTLLQSMTEDQLEELLGEQQLSRLRKRRIAKAQAASKAVGATKTPDTGKTAKTDDKPKEKKSFRDFFGPGV